MKNNISINFKKIVRPMKPLHGVNNGPLHRGNVTDLSCFFKELQPPFVRLHDVNWPTSREVDIHTIFPDFEKDPGDPASYDFEMTDKYLKAIKDLGLDIIYRLGESIATPDYKRFVHPPTDMEKWAQICLGIIKHYNHGWADGFHYDIKYWEIWNEPSVDTMWTGTLDDYLKMYTVTAKAIRAFDSSLKICGPAACSSDRITNRVFLEYINANPDVPHDVYTFHLYGNSVANAQKYLDILAETFQKYNQRECDVFITEWNYAPKTDAGDGFWETIARDDVRVNAKLFRKLAGMEAASYVPGFLRNLQESIVSQANYFETAPFSYFSCFDLYGMPNKVFYALLAYKKLFDLSEQVEVACPYENIYVLAASDGRKSGVVISNYKSHFTEVDLTMMLPAGKNVCDYQLSVLDETRDLEKTDTIKVVNGARFTLPIQRNSVLLLESM